MSPKSLLLLTYYFPPTAAVATYRSLGFARHLPKFGWKVSVVAPSRVAWEPYDPKLLDMVPANTRAVRVPFPTSFVHRAVSRLLPYEVWLPAAWRAAKKAIRDEPPSIVYTTGPPSAVHIMGALVKERVGVPWFACFRDPLISHSKIYLRPLVIRRLEMMVEAMALRRADCIVLNTPSSLATMQRFHPGFAPKMMMLTNGFDPIETSSFEEVQLRAGQLHMLFAGEVYFDRDPGNLLQALKELHLHSRAGPPPPRITFLGRDSDGVVANAVAADPSLSEFVKIRSHVPFEEARKIMQEADILCVLQGAGHQPYIPAKLYEYLAVGKPVFALAERDSDVEWVLKTAGVSYGIAASDDCRGIKLALMRLSEEILESRAKRPSAEKVELFTRERIARELAERLDAFLP